jgi:hypothetical protein
MKNIADENWKVFLSLLPSRWRDLAAESGAIQRLRGFASAEALLRTLLLHIAQGLSLRETVVTAKLAGLAEISDVALLKRLKNSEKWLRLLCLELLQENSRDLSSSVKPFRIIDGTIVKEPGKTGSQWRIHYSIQLPALVCDFFEMTSAKGQGNGESLRRVPVKPGDLIVGDAGYWSVAGISSVTKRGGDVLVRVNPNNFVAFSPTGEPLSLLGLLQTISEPGQIGEWKAVLQSGESSVSGRICAIRKSELAIRQAHRRLERKAVKKQTATRPETLEYVKYVVVFTTQTDEPPAEVLELYRGRWQIELVFKRLKSLAHLGHLPKHDDGSARAWLYGKLLTALLTEKLIKVGRDFSPWGYEIRPSPEDSLA